MKNKFKVLFVYPNVPGSSLVPVNIPILSAVLKENNVDVELFDTTGYDPGDIRNFEKDKEYLLQVKPFEQGRLIYGDKVYEDFASMVNTYKPDLIAVTVVEDTIDYALRLMERVKDYDCPVVVGGVGATFNRGILLGSGSVDIVCKGEGEEAILDIVEYGYFRKEFYPLSNLNNLPFPDFSIFPDNRITRVMHGKKFRMLQVEVDRGCPFKCLEGDTLINTIEGKIPIKKLTKRKSIKVLTYDKSEDRILFADAINIRKTGTNEQLVRVYFDDGSYIDCTPDHRFKKFKNGNQFVPVREYETEAKDLKNGDSVKAISYFLLGYGKYLGISWGRRKRVKEHRLIMEGVIGRKLSKDEWIHHKDKNVRNNHLDNLILTDSENHCSIYHPEISERMKINNPAFNMSDEWKNRIGKYNKGKKRSIETRLKHRDNKLGKNNPNYKHGRRSGTPSRVLKDVNHKVVKVEWLKKKKDTYCMEVPKYHWFYANDVLVHNCSYCCAPALKGMYGQGYYRQKSRERLIQEMTYLSKTYKPDYFDFGSETFLARKDIFDVLHSYSAWINIPFWCQGRPETITEDKVKALKAAGCSDFQLGIEHGNAGFRREYLNRKDTNKQILKACNLLEKHKIPYSVNNIIGWPDETRDLVFDTIELNRMINPKTMNCYMMAPYKGTAIRKRLEEEGLIEVDAKCNQLLGGADIKYKYLSKQEFLGLQRCFPLYARFEKYWWDSIERAEKFDYVGNRIFDGLRNEYIERYYA